MHIPSRVSLILLSCGVLLAQNTTKTELLVLCKGDNSLAVVDVRSGKVTARLMSGPDPHEVVASTDGKLAYISNYGGGAFNTIAIMDLVGMRTVPVLIWVPCTVHTDWFSGGKVWFTAEGAKAIGRFDPVTRQIDWIMGTGQDRTHMLYVTADLKKVYTRNVSSATVTLMEAERKGPAAGGPDPSGPPPGGPPPGGADRWIQADLPLEALTWTGRKPLYLWAEAPRALMSRRTAKNSGPRMPEMAPSRSSILRRKKSSKPFGQRQRSEPVEVYTERQACFGVQPERIRLSDSGCGTRQVIKRIPIGHGAAGIQIEPGGKAYVACTPDDYVAVIDLSVEMAKGHINAGKRPDGLAWGVSRPVI